MAHVETQADPRRHVTGAGDNRPTTGLLGQPMRRGAPALVAVATAGFLMAGCGSSSSSGAVSAPSGSGSAAVSGTVNVFAAASLTDAFTTLGEQFEAAHPGTRIVLNLGPSSGLATQIKAGAPADVFASASTQTMDRVVAGGQASSPTDFASNEMEIAVPVRNPARITRLSDLAGPSVKVALCRSEVPCGATAAKILTNAGLTLAPVTTEVDVRAVLTKVSLGEVDAGVVFVTDVRAAGAKVRGIEIPADVNASTQYPIATLTKAPNKTTAQAFTDFVLSADGSSVLGSAGFARP